MFTNDARRSIDFPSNRKIGVTVEHNKFRFTIMHNLKGGQVS